MKRAGIGLGLLLIAAPFGYCQESTQPLQLTLKSGKQVYAMGEDKALMLTIKNATPDPWNIFDGVNTSKIIIDGKEYSSRKNFPSAWGGPSTLSPGDEISVALSLSAKDGNYDVSEAVFAAGKHNIAVKMNKTVSNTLIIEVKEK